ncbi:MAG: hypothetical protein ACKV2T_21410 [Kofleriaceae bacterium]
MTSAAALLIVVCACSSSSPTGTAEQLEVKVTTATAGIADRAGQVRVELSMPGWASGNAEVLIEGVKATKVESAWWAKLPSAMTTVGPHDVRVMVNTRSKQGKPIRGEAVGRYTVAAGMPTYTLRPAKAARAVATVFCSPCGTDRGARVDVDDKVQISLELTTDSGNLVTWEGATTTSTGAPILLRFSIAPAVGNVPVTALLESGPYRVDSLALPLEISTPDGGVWKTASISLSDAAIATFSQIGRTELELGAADPAGRGSLLILTRVGGSQPKLVGTAPKARDVQLVAIYSTADDTATDCGAYAGKAGGRGTYTISSSALVVDVYDRAANTKVGTKKFPPPRVACPSLIRPGESGTSVTGDFAAAEKYAASFRPR